MRIPTPRSRRARRSVALAATTAALVALAALAAAAPALAARADGDGHIAFTRLTKAGKDIWTIDPDGNHLKQITTSHAATEPAWSPDGTQIAFLGPGGIWLMQADGSGAKLLIPAKDVLLTSRPAWSPDGTQIAFAGTASIYLAAADGSAAPRKLLAGTNPVFSPDGKLIAYVDSQAGKNARIWIANADGTGAHAISKKGLIPQHLSWKSGTTIAYTFGTKTAPVLGLISPDGTQSMLLANGATGVTMSPDSTRYVLAASTANGMGVVSVVRNGSVRPLGDGFAPDWGV